MVYIIICIVIFMFNIFSLNMKVIFVIYDEIYI